MLRLLWVCLGGALGTGARYLASGAALRALGPGFPYGTLLVNVVGSFLIGLAIGIGLRSELLPPTLRLAVTTGFMGGFTTFSTFSYETVQYLEQGAWTLALTNIAVTLALCLGGCFLGAALARALT